MSHQMTDGQHVRTGNKPHAEVSHEQYLKARRWGIKHGYSGASGGWIYDPFGQRVGHGWGQLYSLLHIRIEAGTS